MRRLTLSLAAIGLGLSLSGEVHGCPNCKEAVANQGNTNATRLADGYSWSILLMMAMPFTLLGTGAYFVTRAVRNGALPEF